MSYRDEAEMLRERLREIERAQRAKSAAHDELDAEEARLRAERQEIDRKLRPRRSLPMLDDVRVASPCSEDWSKMSGDDRARFCGKCEKNVYDLSAMTRAEAEAFLARAEGRVCVRFYRRFDGTILTADCSRGVRRRRRRRVAAIAAGVAGAGLLASATLRGFGPTRTQGAVMPREISRPSQTETMGTVAAPRNLAPPKSTVCTCPPGVPLCNC